MTSRERVIRALEFRRPDRVPRDLWALPYVRLFRNNELEEMLDRYPLDIGRAEPSPGCDEEALQRLSKVGTYRDEWGSVWQIGQPGVIGEVRQPALADWSKLDRFQPPWELVRNRDLAHANRLCDQSDKFMLSAVSARPFERLQFLRGSENLYIDLAYDTPELRRLIEMVHEFYIEDVASWADSNVDAVLLMDDWGTNRTLLISPDMWRAVFKPLYRDYCRIIHDAGKYVFFHSDGNIQAIYPDLIELGVNALNSQLFAMDIEDLAGRHKGKITFWGEIDRQHVLPFGTPQEVRKAVRRVRAALDDSRGGVIGQCEWGVADPRENIEAVFEAWQR